MVWCEKLVFSSSKLTPTFSFSCGWQVLLKAYHIANSTSVPWFVIAISIAGRGIWLALKNVGLEQEDIGIDPIKGCAAYAQKLPPESIRSFGEINTCTSRTGQTLVRWKTWARFFAINGVHVHVLSKDDGCLFHIFHPHD